MKDNDTLKLTLHAWWFHEIHQGRKKNEYRDDTPYWRSRLLDTNGYMRKYKRICFINGYGKHRPRMVVEWLNCDLSNCFDISLGKVISTENMSIFKVPTKPPKDY